MFGHSKIVEKRIQEAQKNGEFDNLPGRGKPIEYEEDRHIPEDLRLAYKILKNADCLPPEVEEKREIRQMEDMLANIPDEKEKYKLIKKINYKIMKLNMQGNKSPQLEEKQIYYKKLVERLGKK
jgi:DnaJ homologue, subfamily C, member 28, conserved domain